MHQSNRAPGRWHRYNQLFQYRIFRRSKTEEDWRPVFHENKDELIAAMNRELNNKIPGVVWGFSQPIEDNMEEAVSGVKGELAIKVYGDSLKDAGRQERADRRHYGNGEGCRRPGSVSCAGTA